MNSLLFRGSSTALLYVVFVTLVSAAAAADDLPPPDADTQAAVSQILNEAVGLTGASSPAQKKQAISRLMQMAANSTQSPDELYVILDQSFPLIYEVGDAATLKKAIDAFDASFEVTPDARIGHWVAFISKTKSTSDFDAAIDVMLPLVHEAAKEGRYDDASKWLTRGAIEARRVSSTDAYGKLSDLRGVLKDRFNADVAQQKAVAVLADQPDHPEANLLLGKWKGVYEQNWEEALPLLEKGSDAAWKSAAKEESTAIADRDASATRAAKVGGAWWNAAEGESGVTKRALQVKSHSWYAMIKPQDLSPLEKVFVTKRLAELNQSLSASDESMLASQVGVIEHPNGQWIDLMSMIQLPEHVIDGTWERRGSSIVGLSKDRRRVMAPYAIDGDYTIAAEFTRLDGNDGVGIALPVGDTAGMFVVSGYRGKISGLLIVDGKRLVEQEPDSTNIAKNIPIKNGQRYRLVVDVRLGRADLVSIDVTLNEEPILNWKGKTLSLTPDSGYFMVNLRTPGLFVWDSLTEFHNLEVRLGKGGSGVRLGEDWGDPFHDVDDSPPRQVLSQCVTWNDKKYFFYGKSIDLAKARVLAKKLRGRILTISSDEEAEFISQHVGEGKYWMAGFLRNGVWRDERNRPLEYFRWAPNEPNNRGGLELGMCVLSNVWADYPYTGSKYANHPVIIEWGEEYPTK